MRRVIASILVVVGLVGLVGVVADFPTIVNMILGPVDDSSYFCSAPDRAPVPEAAATKVLQECAAGKTVAIRVGQTASIDLDAEYGVDSGTVWRGLGVSNPGSLRQLSDGVIRKRQPYRADLVAVYRAIATGTSSVTAVQYFCGGPHQVCDRGHRWGVWLQIEA